MYRLLKWCWISVTRSRCARIVGRKLRTWHPRTMNKITFNNFLILVKKNLTSCHILVDKFGKLVVGKHHVGQSFRKNHRRFSESVNQFCKVSSCVFVSDSFRSQTCHRIADLFGLIYEIKFMFRSVWSFFT